MKEQAQVSSVFRLAVENIPPLWPQLEEMIEKARCNLPTFTTEDVFRLLMSHRADAWIQVSEQTGPIIQALVITDYEATTQGVWLRCWLACASGKFRMNYKEFRRQIENWKERQRCRGLTLIGRHGWTRLFPEAKVEGLIMRITDDPEE